MKAREVYSVTKTYFENIGKKILFLADWYLKGTGLPQPMRYGMTAFEQTHLRLHQNQFLKLSVHLEMKGKEE